ncbi:HAMP domain-containing protein [Rhodobacterales bacterium HKCCE3408]|nr:HAMP domain-containing protein [Rhodobacterales bacterium HKCCE3408]
MTEADKSSSTGSARRGIPVFVKIAGLIALTTLVVTSVMTVMAHKYSVVQTEEHVRTLGREMSRSAAEASGPAIRFGNLDALAEGAQDLIHLAEGQLVGMVVFSASGEALVSEGEPTDAALAELAALSRAAMESGTSQFGADGYQIVVPAFAGDSPVGTIATVWTPELALAAVNSELYLKTGVAMAVFLVMVGISSLLLQPLVARPLTHVAGIIDELARGHYDVTVSHADRTDEIGAIARNLSALRSNLTAGAEATAARDASQAHQREVVQRLSEMLGALAQYDLTVRMDDPLGPEYEVLRADFNRTVETIVEVIQSVSDNANAIRLAAEEINTSSEDLSRRTENQAASLEETAASLDQITGNVRSSAEGAQEVENIVRDAQSTAEQSDKVVREAVSAMSTIEESSRQISQIISVIDDIAFQTNLLALNAGVEAARAGEAGRGFAVVASEVRALAQRSSDAAKEIKDLINQSSKQVEHGVDLVGRAGQELRTIIESVSTISAHIGTITTASADQSASLAEINTGVTQLDQVTQQNAAMVEESTAASLQLRNDADRLADSVARFRLPTTGFRDALMETRRAS